MSEPLSPKNPSIVRLRALTRQRRARRDAGRFVVEGIKLVSEVLRSALPVYGVYVDEAWDVPSDVMNEIVGRGLEPVLLGAGGIDRIASTTAPQPIIAEVGLPDAGWGQLAKVQHVVVAVDLNDPGNVGTLLRSAEAAGFDGLIALGETADPFGPKAVRASAGAVFRQQIVIDPDVEAGLERLATLGLERIGTRMDDAEPCDSTDLSGPVALVLGSEAHGLNSAAAATIDRWVRIPMAGDIESLNVAMAGTILTYEVGRQRRAAIG
jgi:TrmH family RNA methyltransferase